MSHQKIGRLGVDAREPRCQSIPEPFSLLRQASTPAMCASETSWENFVEDAEAMMLIAVFVTLRRSGRRESAKCMPGDLSRRKINVGCWKRWVQVLDPASARRGTKA